MVQAFWNVFLETIRQSEIAKLIAMAGIMVLVIGLLSMASHHYTLNIKSRTVGDGQHGTARWATKEENVDALIADLRGCMAQYQNR